MQQSYQHEVSDVSLCLFTVRPLKYCHLYGYNTSASGSKHCQPPWHLSSPLLLPTKFSSMAMPKLTSSADKIILHPRLLLPISTDLNMDPQPSTLPWLSGCGSIVLVYDHVHLTTATVRHKYHGMWRSTAPNRGILITNLSNETPSTIVLTNRSYVLVHQRETCLPLEWHDTISSRVPLAIRFPWAGCGVVNLNLQIWSVSSG